MLTLSQSIFFVAAFASVGTVLPAAAQTPAGMLECNVSPSVRAGATSSKALSCIFHAVNGPLEYYNGTLNMTGVDVGFTDAGHLSWGVAIAGPYPPQYPLVGTYTGASGGLTVLAGAEANTLVGGNGSSVSLQPLSVSTQTGLDINLGIASLTLIPAENVPPPR